MTHTCTHTCMLYIHTCTCMCVKSQHTAYLDDRSRSAASRTCRLLQVFSLYDICQVRDALFGGRGRGRGSGRDRRPTGQRRKMCRGVVNGLLGCMPLHVETIGIDHTHTHTHQHLNHTQVFAPSTCTTQRWWL